MDEVQKPINSVIDPHQNPLDFTHILYNLYIFGFLLVCVTVNGEVLILISFIILLYVNFNEYQLTANSCM
jgi:hypothetical protein